MNTRTFLVAPLALAALALSTPVARAQTLPPPVVRPVFSMEAAEVARLLDQGKVVAADHLLTSYMPYHANDAGLYAQYVRLLMMGYEMDAAPFIRNPILTDDRYNLLYVRARALQIGMELDPKLKPYMADAILRTLYKTLSALASAGGGYIVGGNVTNHQINMAWQAIELSPSVAKTWAASFQTLIPRFLKNGKGVSAMWTANLTGDLETGAVGDSDFWRATTALRDAAKTCNTQTVNDAATLYLSVFTDDCKRLRTDSRFMEMITALRTKGCDLAPFKNKGISV